MIRIDCAELSADDKLAIAARISDSMAGRVIALAKGPFLVLDQLAEEAPDVEAVRGVVSGWASASEDPSRYSVEVLGETVIVHSRENVSKSEKEVPSLPPNLRACPMCAFITLYEEEYVVHLRSHYFGV